MRTNKALSVLLLALALVTVSACGGSTSDPPVAGSFSTPTGTGSLRMVNTLWVVNLSGSYRDMGRQYGALLAGELHDLYTDLDQAVGFNNARTQAILAAIGNVRDPRETDFLNGMADESGLSFDQHVFLSASLFFMFVPGCSAFGAMPALTDSGTIAGRNFDSPKAFAPFLSGRSILVIYNPQGQVTSNGTLQHRDNAVAAMTHLGWFYGLTNLNSKGIYLEYNNGMNSIPEPSDTRELLRLVGGVMDGLHRNLYAAFDSDTLADVDQRLLTPASIPTLTQVADKDVVWHYERTPYPQIDAPAVYARKIPAGGATGGSYSYKNPPNTSIFTNHFFFTDWSNQNLDPNKFSQSRTIRRLINLQALAQQAIQGGKITAQTMRDIMTTHLTSTDGGGPFIGWELDNPDVTHFTSVTDIANRTMYVYPNVDALHGNVQWAQIDLNKEFR